MRATFLSRTALLPLALGHAIAAMAHAAPLPAPDKQEVGGGTHKSSGALRGWDGYGVATKKNANGEADADDESRTTPQPQVLDSLSACLLLIDEDIYYDQNGEAISVIPLDRTIFEGGSFLQDGPATATRCPEEDVERGTCFEIFPEAEDSHVVVCELCRFLDDDNDDNDDVVVPCRPEVIDIAVKCLAGPCLDDGPNPKEMDAGLMERRNRGRRGDRDLTSADNDDTLGTQKSRWMESLHAKGLMQGVTLNDMVLPGSHNTAAVSLDANKHCGRVDLHFDRLVNEVAQNQDVGIFEQMAQRGIRFLDLRAIENDSFEGREYPLHHSYLIDEEHTNTLYGAFDEIERFLQSNKFETLVVRIDGYNGCRDTNKDHRAIWKAEVERRQLFRLMTDKHLTTQMTDLRGLALVDIDRRQTLEYWPGKGFGLNTLNDDGGPFVYGEYYKKKVGALDKFSIWDFNPQTDEVGIAQTLANPFFDGLEDWDKPYMKHMWMMHSLVGLRAMGVNAIMTDRVGQTPVYDVATQLTLYRIIEKHFPSVDSVKTTDFVNAFDEEFEHHCPMRYVLQGFESNHDNGTEDRKWKFVCRRVDWLDSQSYTNSSPSSWGRRQYHPSAFRTDFNGGGGVANDFDGDVNFLWTDGSMAITGIGGKHSNRSEDRRWYFYASRVINWSVPPSCSWTVFVNDLDGPMDYQTKKDEWIAGVASQHKNYNEDRRWKFYVCR